MNRRELLSLSIVAASALIGSGCSKPAPKPIVEPIVKIVEVEPEIKMMLPKSNAQRVVVVGGGWAGLAMAKHMKKVAPQMDVILLEQRSQFFSLPTSNLWLVGAIDMEYLIHDYLQAARENNYTYINTTVIDVDKSKQIVVTTHGGIDYDYLVLAPGIEYDYSRWSSDIRYSRELQMHYPAGFLSSSELLTIRNKIFDFKAGVFVITIPSGNYRALAAPYERALLMADFFKREGRHVTILILDENPKPRIHAALLKQFFDERYKEIISYRSSVIIQAIDIEKRSLHVNDGSVISFDDAIFYPHVKSTALLEKIGVLNDQGEAQTDPLNNAWDLNDTIYIIGDARRMQLERLASTAISEARHLARMIFYRSMGESLLWASPESISFCAVGMEPLQVISQRHFYHYNLLQKRFSTVEIHESNNLNSNEDDKTLFEWANRAFGELFKA